MTNMAPAAGYISPPAVPVPVDLPGCGPRAEVSDQRSAIANPRLGQRRGGIRERAEGTEVGLRLFAYLMKQILSEHQLILLREVVDGMCPDLNQRVTSADIGGLTWVERERIVGALGSEFASSGTGSDWEPTERGLQLEALLDIINRPILDGSAPT